MTISTAPAATNEGSLQKELKACRLQLQQAERRSAATIESRDGVAKKLEEATDQIAELQRRLELEVNILAFLNNKAIINQSTTTGSSKRCLC